jgi:hypothetical protein
MMGFFTGFRNIGHRSVDPKEEVTFTAQEVQDHVEAVLNSLYCKHS